MLNSKRANTIDTRISTALGGLEYKLERTGSKTEDGTAYSLKVMSSITQTDGKIAADTDTIGNITNAQINALFE